MRKVNSSNLAGFGFTETEEGVGILTVEFRNGRTYTYEVPAEVSESLDRVADAGESVGSYFAKNIRPYFPATEVTD